MPAQKMIAIVLLVAGTLALVYGGFSYTKETHTADMGPLHISVQKRNASMFPCGLVSARS